MKLKISRKQLCIPYALFLAVFVLLPILIIVYYAFTDSKGTISFQNFIDFFTNSTSLMTLLSSIGLGALTTVLCILIGYPVAYILSNSKYNKNTILVLLFVMPMWINFVMRASALREIFNWLGMGGNNMVFFKVLVGMVMDFLPFMILPLYTTMLKMDRSVLEAAADLGANNRQVFFKAVVPLSLPGVVSGITMVFMPTMTCYVISDMLSERSFEVLGNLIERNFVDNWNLASAIAIVLLVIIGIGMLITNKFGDGSAEARGGGLW